MNFQSWRGISMRAAQLAWEATSQEHLARLLKEEGTSQWFNELTLALYNSLEKVRNE